MEKLLLTIDGREIEGEKGETILSLARKAGIYIPSLCYHPDLPAFETVKSLSQIYRGDEIYKGEEGKGYEGCGLCAVEVKGTDAPVLSCNTIVTSPLEIRTDSASLSEIRRERLAGILIDHPHTCLQCAQREGCSLTQCSSSVKEEERCCTKFGACELRKVAEYVGIKQDISRYIPQGLKIIQEEPLFKRDFNLCISCTRCVRACKELRGVDALGLTFLNGKAIVGSKEKTLTSSECKFCGACVEVCPTGALTDKDLKKGREISLIPCKYTCPANIDVPKYIRLIHQGQDEGALFSIREKVALPAVLGRVCNHPCETVCRRGEVNEPIAICLLKRFASEWDKGEWKKKLKEPLPTGKRIAIVGAGPAGLTAAYHLKRKGHQVTLFDAQPEPGGMLKIGIPSYRLPKELLSAEIQQILDLGIDFQGNKRIGKDFSLQDIKEKGYDSIVLALGLQVSRRIKLEGDELNGVYWGVDFLRTVNSNKKVDLGREIAVIGGGNVAMDVALSALRLGGAKVSLYCLEGREEMPAFPWEVKEAIEEGINIHNGWGPKRIIGDNGSLKGIELVKCLSVFDSEGRFNPRFDENTVIKEEADRVILAIGQALDPSALEELGLSDKRGFIEVNGELETNIKGVFAAGDAIGIPGSVIEAISSGKKVASSVDKYLGGDGLIDETEVLVSSESPSPYIGRNEGFAQWKRSEATSIPLSDRVQGFLEIEEGFSEALAREEAKRCLRCDLRLNISPPILPPELYLEFTMENINMVPSREGVFQLLDADKNVYLIKGTANLSEELKGEFLQGRDGVIYFLYDEDPFYTKRESELMQQYIQSHGRMPEGNSDLDDLFD